MNVRAEPGTAVVAHRTANVAQLGLPWGTIIGAAVDAGRSLFGDDDFTSCAGQASPQQVAYVLSRTNASERAELDRLIRATNPGWYTGFANMDAAAFAFNVAGGSDCKISSTPGRALAAYWSTLRAKYPMPLGLPSATSPLPVLMDPGPALGPTTGAPIDAGPVLVGGPQPSLPGVPDVSIWDRLVNIGKDTLSAAGRAAAGAAVPAIYQQLPDSARAQVDQYAAQAYATRVESGISRYMPLIIGGTVVVAGAALLSRGRRAA